MPAPPALPGLLRPLQTPCPRARTLVRQPAAEVRPAVRGLGAAAVPDSRAAAARGFPFIVRWRLQFGGISQRVPIRGAGKPPGALGWAYLLFSGLTWGLRGDRKVQPSPQGELAPGKPERARFRRQNCLHTLIRDFTPPPPPPPLPLLPRGTELACAGSPRPTSAWARTRGCRAKLPLSCAAMEG